jgi:FixJ family two-component response regulator
MAVRRYSRHRVDSRATKELETDAAMESPSSKELVSPQPLVSVVDDDESVRESLPDLLQMLGFRAESFSSAEEFLESGAAERTQCLILDVSMQGLSGPELQRKLRSHGATIPIIFITAHADDGVRLGLLEQGAVECLFKPFSEEDLLAALEAALPKPP